MTTLTFEATMVERTAYYSNTVDWESAPVVIVEGIGRNSSIKQALEAFNDTNGEMYLVHGVRQITSKKKLAALLAAGARDLRNA